MQLGFSLSSPHNPNMGPSTQGCLHVASTKQVKQAEGLLMVVHIHHILLHFTKSPGHTRIVDADKLSKGLGECTRVGGSSSWIASARDIYQSGLFLVTEIQNQQSGEVKCTSQRVWAQLEWCSRTPSTLPRQAPSGFCSKRNGMRSKGKE